MILTDILLMNSGSSFIYPWREKFRSGLVAGGLFFSLNSLIVFIFDKYGLTVNGVAYKSLAEAFHADKSVLWGLIFPVAGLGILYLAAAYWWNSTTYTVANSVLNIKIGPLPWAKSEVSVYPSTAVYVEKYLSATSENEVRIIEFRIQIIGNGGTEVTIGSFRHLNDAKNLQSWLVERLKIKQLEYRDQTEVKSA